MTEPVKPKAQWDTYVMDIEVNRTGMVAVRARSAAEAEQYVTDNLSYNDLDGKSCLDCEDDPIITSGPAIDNNETWAFHVDEEQEAADDEDAEFEESADEEDSDEEDPLGD